MESGEVEFRGLPGDCYVIEAGPPTCVTGRQLDWFPGSPAIAVGAEVWEDEDGTRTHRAVFYRIRDGS